MKNGIQTIDRDTVAAFDWALNEQCFQYDECARLEPFTRAGKAVFQVEYHLPPSAVLPAGETARLQLTPEAPQARRLAFTCR